MNNYLKAEREVNYLTDCLIKALRNAGELLQGTENDQAVYDAESVATDLEFGEELTSVISALHRMIE